MPPCSYICKQLTKNCYSSTTQQLCKQVALYWEVLQSLKKSKLFVRKNSVGVPQNWPPPPSDKRKVDGPPVDTRVLRILQVLRLMITRLPLSQLHYEREVWWVMMWNKIWSWVNSTLPNITFFVMLYTTISFWALAEKFQHNFDLRLRWVCLCFLVYLQNFRVIVFFFKFQISQSWNHSKSFLFCTYFIMNQVYNDLIEDSLFNFSSMAKWCMHTCMTLSVPG